MFPEKEPSRGLRSLGMGLCAKEFLLVEDVEKFGEMDKEGGPSSLDENRILWKNSRRAMRC